MSETQTEPNCVFIGGAARSGTTYVQLLLYASGDFASAQETHLFPAFLGRLEDVWDRFEERAKINRDVGLPTVIPRARFEELMRPMAVEVMRDISRRRPEAAWTLEKTPENILVWPLITRLLPRARFINVIRDPRAVVASTIAARTWAGEWAHREVAQIAEAWVRSVRAGIALEGAQPNVARVRFERLRAQPRIVTGELLAKFGLPAPPQKVQRMLAAVALPALKAKKAPAPWSLVGEPRNFFRLGAAASWRKELSVADIAVIEEVAHAEMKVLGYTPAVRLAGSEGEAAEASEAGETR